MISKWALTSHEYLNNSILSTVDKKNITDVIRKLGEVYKRTFHLKSIEQINRGLCENFAKDVKRIMRTYMRIVRLGEDTPDPDHHVIYYNGRYYDAEDPKGVKVITELKSVKSVYNPVTPKHRKCHVCGSKHLISTLIKIAGRRKTIKYCQDCTNKERKKFLKEFPGAGCKKCGSTRIFPYDMKTALGRIKRIWWCEECGSTMRRKKPDLSESKPERIIDKDVTKVVLGQDYKEYRIKSSPIKGLQLNGIIIYASNQKDFDKFTNQLRKWLLTEHFHKEPEIKIEEPIKYISIPKMEHTPAPSYVSKEKQTDAELHKEILESIVSNVPKCNDFNKRAPYVNAKAELMMIQNSKLNKREAIDKAYEYFISHCKSK